MADIHVQHPAVVQHHFQLPKFGGDRKDEFKTATDVRRFTVSSKSSVHTKRLATTSGALFPKGELDALVEYLLAETPENENPKPTVVDLATKQQQNRSFSPGRKSSPAFGTGGFGDHFTEHWDWPLSHPVVVTDKDNNFEAVFDVEPFSTDEVEAHVVCTDLNIALTTKGKQHSNYSVDRTYHMPLNVDPKSVKFFLNEAHGKLKVTANIIPPLEMHVAIFADLSDVRRLKNGLSLANLVKLRHMRDTGVAEEKVAQFLKGVLEEIKQQK